MAEDISARVAWALKKALTPKDATATSGRGTATFVRRDESGVGWVRIPGNDFDTPVAGGIVAEAQPGDTVTYNIENNGVTITGNSTSPSVGGRFVDAALAPVRKAVSGLGGRVAASLTIAEAAQAVASAVNQHFWPDSNGIHVTEVTQEDWVVNHSGANVLINALGQLFRDGLNNLLAIMPSGIAIYDGNGNNAENVVASFSANETHIGRGTGTVYLANDTFTMSAEHSPTDVDPEQIITAADLSVSDSTSDYDLFSNMNISMSTKETDAADTYTSVSMEAYVDKNMGDYALPVSRAGITSTAYAEESQDSSTLIYADNVQLNGNKVTFKDPSNSNDRLQLGNPTRYQNSGNYAITTAGVTSLHNGPRITIPAGSYIFVGAWTFNTGSSSGQRNLQLGFRSGASGDIWGERVRVMAAANNFAVLNVSALRTFDAQTTVYLAGSSSMTSGSASAWITAVRLN